MKPRINSDRRGAEGELSIYPIVSEFRFVCFRGLHKNDPRNHTKSHEQSCFVWLRGSFSISSQSLKIFQNRFRVNCDLDDVTYDDSAFVHCVVPTDAKVLSID